MLFLAVFLGFVAENIRENNSNREIEKSNIESFVRNLGEDSLAITQSIKVNEKRFSYLDSLIYLKNSNVDNYIYRRQFIYYMLKLAYLNYFTSNGSAFEQMKSSGTLRLIHHQNVLDSVLNYETYYQRLKSQEELCSKFWNKAIEQVSAFVDFTALVNLPPEKLWDVSEKDLANTHLPDIKKDLPALQSYFNWRVNERISLGYYVQYLNNQLAIVKTLIPFLQNEYHLENE